MTLKSTTKAQSDYQIFVLLTVGFLVLEGSGIYLQIYLRTPWPAVLICKRIGGVVLFYISQKERLFHIL